MHYTESYMPFAGPYTVFAPTDKAFRALLVQLGGPDKAEEKFKENPRLLSGVRCSSLFENRVYHYVSCLSLIHEMRLHNFKSYFAGEVE
jgi:hypothetical protein